MHELEKRGLTAQVLRKLNATGRNETVCLVYWEVELLLDYIRSLVKKGAQK